jgi:hypothetical protein
VELFTAMASANPTFYADLTNPQSLNKYQYCYNNPLRYTDPDGHLADTLLDIGFVGYDVYKIVREGPTKTNLLALGGDVLGAAVPFMTGVGAAVRLGTKADDVVDAVRMIDHAGDAGKTLNRVDDAADVGRVSLSKEPSQLARGKAAHKAEPVRPGERAEVPTPSGKRMDRYDETKAHIREIKPGNPRQVKAGEKQLQRYKQEMEAAKKKPHTTELTTY